MNRKLKLVLRDLCVYLKGKLSAKDGLNTAKFLSKKLGDSRKNTMK